MVQTRNSWVGVGEPDGERLIPNLNQRRETAVTRKESDWSRAS